MRIREREKKVFNGSFALCSVYSVVEFDHEVMEYEEFKSEF